MKQRNEARLSRIQAAISEAATAASCAFHRSDAAPSVLAAQFEPFEEPWRPVSILSETRQSDAAVSALVLPARIWLRDDLVLTSIQRWYASNDPE